MSLRPLLGEAEADRRRHDLGEDPHLARTDLLPAFLYRAPLDRREVEGNGDRESGAAKRAEKARLVREVAERVRMRILDLRCRTATGVVVTVSASCGGATLNDSVTTSDQLLVAADEALYRAKSRGRDRVAMDETMVSGIVPHS